MFLVLIFTRSLELFQDKQMEALVEKLCNRFSGVTGIENKYM